MKKFITLAKLKHGDQVAVISPSTGLPGLFPWVQDLGLKRMEEDFGLSPKEYPTTRQMGSSLQDRARDVMAAFADKNNKAVFSSIGGHDQIKLLKYLEPNVFLANPKPFFGFSDNTHLHLYLWNLGIPSYYGGGVMSQFGMNQSMHDLTVNSIKHALSDEGEFELEVSKKYNDINLEWAEPDNLNKPRIMEANDGLFWDGSGDVQGLPWGGCVEALIAQVATGKYLPVDSDLENTILFLETAEDIPEHWIIGYLLNGFGERGWLDKFKAVMVGRPKAWDLTQHNSKTQKAAYREGQRQTVLKAVREYNKEIPVIQNLDFGHTDPQISLPMGQIVKIKSSSKKILITY